MDIFHNNFSNFTTKINNRNRRFITSIIYKIWKHRFCPKILLRTFMCLRSLFGIFKTIRTTKKKICYSSLVRHFEPKDQRIFMNILQNVYSLTVLEAFMNYVPQKYTFLYPSFPVTLN